MSDFTKAFIASSSTPYPTIPTTPQRKIQAANHAQEIEDELDDEELTILLNVLQEEPYAADFYLSLKRDSLRKNWVRKKIAPLAAPKFQ
jgi:hypothetical protein